MFVAHGIPYFYELLHSTIYKFADRVSKSSNPIITACMTPIVYIHSPIRQFIKRTDIKRALSCNILFCDILLLLLFTIIIIIINIIIIIIIIIIFITVLIYVLTLFFIYVYRPSVCNKNILLMLSSIRVCF